MEKKKAATKAADEYIFSSDCNEEDENGFSEGVGPVGDVIKTFSFADKVTAPEKLIDNRRLQKQPYGITPPVDGERFEVRRTFVFRRSTVKMLNKLKAEHEDENVYLSSILDEAVRHYFGFVFSK